MISIFSSPKAFSKHTGIIQRNAVQSWSLLEPRPEVILLGNEVGVADAAHELKVRHVAHVACNEFGTPFVNSLFESTSAAANVGLSCGITTATMPALLKLTYIFQMWAGRLEFMSVFTILGFLYAAVRGK